MIGKIRNSKTKAENDNLLENPQPVNNALPFNINRFRERDFMSELTDPATAFTSSPEYTARNKNKAESIEKSLLGFGKTIRAITKNNVITDELFLKFVDFIRKDKTSLTPSGLRAISSIDDSILIEVMENILNNSILNRKSLEEMINLYKDGLVVKGFGIRNTVNENISQILNKIRDSQIVPFDFIDKYYKDKAYQIYPTIPTRNRFFSLNPNDSSEYNNSKNLLKYFEEDGINPLKTYLISGSTYNCVQALNTVERILKIDGGELLVEVLSREIDNGLKLLKRDKKHSISRLFNLSSTILELNMRIQEKKTDDPSADEMIKRLEPLTKIGVDLLNENASAFFKMFKSKLQGIDGYRKFLSDDAILKLIETSKKYGHPIDYIFTNVSKKKGDTNGSGVYSGTNKEIINFAKNSIIFKYILSGTRVFENSIEFAYNNISLDDLKYSPSVRDFFITATRSISMYSIGNAFSVNSKRILNEYFSNKDERTDEMDNFFNSIIEMEFSSRHHLNTDFNNDVLEYISSVSSIFSKNESIGEAITTYKAMELIENINTNIIPTEIPNKKLSNEEIDVLFGKLKDELSTVKKLIDIFGISEEKILDSLDTYSYRVDKRYLLSFLCLAKKESASKILKSTEGMDFYGVFNKIYLNQYDMAYLLNKSEFNINKDSLGIYGIQSGDINFDLNKFSNKEIVSIMRNWYTSSPVNGVNSASSLIKMIGEVANDRQAAIASEFGEWFIGLQFKSSNDKFLRGTDAKNAMDGASISSVKTLIATVGPFIKPENITIRNIYILNILTSGLFSLEFVKKMKIGDFGNDRNILNEFYNSIYKPSNSSYESGNIGSNNYLLLDKNLPQGSTSDNTFIKKFDDNEFKEFENNVKKYRAEVFKEVIEKSSDDKILYFINKGPFAEDGTIFGDTKYNSQSLDVINIALKRYEKYLYDENYTSITADSLYDIQKKFGDNGYFGLRLALQSIDSIIKDGIPYPPESVELLNVSNSVVFKIFKDIEDSINKGEIIDRNISSLINFISITENFLQFQEKTSQDKTFENILIEARELFTNIVKNNKSIFFEKLLTNIHTKDDIRNLNLSEIINCINVDKEIVLPANSMIDELSGSSTDIIDDFLIENKNVVENSFAGSISKKYIKQNISDDIVGLLGNDNISKLIAKNYIKEISKRLALFNVSAPLLKIVAENYTNPSMRGLNGNNKDDDTIDIDIMSFDYRGKGMRTGNKSYGILRNGKEVDLENSGDVHQAISEIINNTVIKTGLEIDLNDIIDMFLGVDISKGGISALVTRYVSENEPDTKKWYKNLLVDIYDKNIKLVYESIFGVLSEEENKDNLIERYNKIVSDIKSIDDDILSEGDKSSVIRSLPSLVHTNDFQNIIGQSDTLRKLFIRAINTTKNIEDTEIIPSVYEGDINLYLMELRANIFDYIKKSSIPGGNKMLLIGELQGNRIDAKTDNPF